MLAFVRTYIHAHAHSLIIDRISQEDTAILILSIATTMIKRIIMIMIILVAKKMTLKKRK